MTFYAPIGRILGSQGNHQYKRLQKPFSDAPNRSFPRQTIGLSHILSLCALRDGKMPISPSLNKHWRGGQHPSLPVLSKTFPLVTMTRRTTSLLPLLLGILWPTIVTVTAAAPWGEQWNTPVSLASMTYGHDGTLQLVGNVVDTMMCLPRVLVSVRSLGSLPGNAANFWK